MSTTRPNVNPRLPAWTPALVLAKEKAEELAERHRAVAAERDEWVRRVGTYGWRLETARRQAAALACSPWLSDAVRQQNRAAAERLAATVGALLAAAGGAA